MGFRCESWHAHQNTKRFNDFCIANGDVSGACGLPTLPRRLERSHRCLSVQSAPLCGPATREFETSKPAGVLWHASIGINIISGLVGGGVLGQIITLLLPSVVAAAESGNLSMGGIVSQAIAGGEGEAILTALIGAIKNKAAA